MPNNRRTKTNNIGNGIQKVSAATLTSSARAAGLVPTGCTLGYMQKQGKSIAFHPLTARRGGRGRARAT